ncbi:MAG: uracil-DNA glycosylase [Planctomycetaceae bacterium]
MSGRTVRQYLQMLASAGIRHLPTVRLPAPAPKPGRGPTTVQRRPAPDATAAPSSTALMSKSTVRVPEARADAAELLNQSFDTQEAKTSALCSLSKMVADCRRCSELADSRTQTVFGVGNPNARIMFIGEAPGADEDRQGEPFVGPAGQLLNKIITASGWKREDLYICNVLRCRPPGNRNPLPQEAANCREFLDGQIRIVDPDYIICWGTVAAQNLLNVETAVGKLRGRFLSYGRAKVLCTYHPSYLLRNESAKKLVWEDMKFFLKELESADA